MNDSLATADYGGRAPLRRCATCGHLWREPGACPACAGDETLPAEAGNRASGRATLAPAGRPSLGVSSLDSAEVPPSASAALVGAVAQGGPIDGLAVEGLLAGFGTNNPVAFAVRFMIAAGWPPSPSEWPSIVEAMRVCEATVPLSPEARAFLAREAHGEAA